ncbi:MAG: PQQ-like beta-propeller repeat protein [Candidatus Bathyarchaeota archaeon]|nr:PQQ-like beta-propeller repeat protein [Candidatus Bathyarchaeota archaeon]
MKTGKIASVMVAVFLVLSIGSSMTLIPTTNAHTPPWQIPTFAYVMATPNPIGIGQSTYIYMWIDKILPSAAIANDYRWHNYKLTLTKPDNTTEVRTWDVVMDTTSSQGFSYTPDQVGTYQIKFEFPGQAVNAYGHANDLFVNDTYLPSSATGTFIVQEEPIGDFPASYPLPTEYWTRPIYGENPYWWTISSDWLGTGSPMQTTYGRYVPNGVGPLTSHIMWTKPVQAGGVVGGNEFATAGDTYFEGSAYISRYRNPIIVSGQLIYKEPLGFSSSNGGPLKCVDLRTGQVLWSRTDIPALSFAYIYDTQQPNQHGVMQPVLCTANFAQCFDAWTGNPLFNVTNVPSGIAALGPQGEVLRWVVTNCGNTTNPNWYLAQWNSSRLFTTTGLSPSQSGVYDASLASRYDWNVSIPWLNVMGSQTETTVQFDNGTYANIKGYSASGTNPNAANPSTQVYAFYGDVIICRNGSQPGVGSFGRAYSTTSYTYFAVNINQSKGALGSIRWWNTLAPPANLTSVLQGPADQVSGVFTESYRETSQWVGYSLATGQKLWGPTASQPPLDYYGYFFPGLAEGQVIAPNKLYSAGMAGIVYCYDTTNGNLLWTFGNGGAGNNTNSEFQVPGPYPTFIYAVCNDVVYTMTTEHTVETPIYKNARTRALNATDGTVIWTLSNYNGGGTSAAAVADGFATFYNGYDNQVYVVGKGPSALTVEAPLADITLGQGLVIRGTVTDICAGTKQTEQAARFPSGVPVMSDESMTDWMEYIYQQKPKPTNATGVPVSIDVIDQNGNYRNIGVATTDMNGAYSYQWVPDIEGKYTLIATFAGSNAYWPSSSETFFAVDPSSSAPTPSQTTSTSAADLYLLPGIIAIILVIIIVGVVLLLAIRRRP